MALATCVPPKKYSSSFESWTLRHRKDTFTKSSPSRDCKLKLKILRAQSYSKIREESKQMTEAMPDETTSSLSLQNKSPASALLKVKFAQEWQITLLESFFFFSFLPSSSIVAGRKLHPCVILTRT